MQPLEYSFTDNITNENKQKFKVICSEVNNDINDKLHNLNIKSVSRPSLIYARNMYAPYKICVTVEFNKAVENILNN